MKKILILISIVFILTACNSSADIDYKIIEEEEPGEGRIVARLVTDANGEDEIKSIIDKLSSDEYWGSDSITARIHEPSDSEEFGKLVAIAKYAWTEKGLAQIGENERDKVYINFE
ncbi:membrane lipoprotein lipid attachment site-containing protein [Virgibacillus sp. AGTR]|uniref:membrane lipoprotein lipid attachment site-containing protein n=1 Tax=Virgibacillus sp. AGTR TaxID=2812055 RepID=UPI001D16E8FB|nr:membrane lipoprotein lipid attachment site-containing protein [Virgibacillus sp. AGTR]MCC2250025.1 membrane lipoprotein lipid attachment site-containing protein [Virgibacillus sp. AGTR]